MQVMNGDSTKENVKQNTENELSIATDTDDTAETNISDELDLKYQKAVQFMESVKCMTPCKDKVKMYKRAAEQFADLGGYQDCEVLMKKCKRKAKKVKEEIVKNTYERALYHKDRAKTPYDYTKAAAEFRKTKEYLDSKEQAAACDLMSKTAKKRGIRKIFLNWGILIFCILIFIIGIRASFTKYMLADAFMATGSYHYATSLYDKLGTYRDSEKKLMESRYRYGLSLEKQGEYTDSLKVFNGLSDYKDSQDKVVKLEKQVIKSSKAGDIVTVGGTKWVVLEIKDQQVFLFKKTGLKALSFHNISEDITWGSSQLRKYLNDEYFKKELSPQEQKNIMLSAVKNNDNTVYGTDGGIDTKDNIFILSIEEVQKYSKVLPDLNIDAWLRTPGSTQNSASFYSADGKIMDYGYDVSSSQITVHPVMWYNFGD